MWKNNERISNDKLFGINSKALTDVLVAETNSASRETGGRLLSCLVCALREAQVNCQRASLIWASEGWTSELSDNVGAWHPPFLGRYGKLGSSQSHFFLNRSKQVLKKWAKNSVIPC